MSAGYNAIIFGDLSSRLWHTKTLGPYRIATELRKHGYTTKVIDFFGEWLENPKDFFKLLDMIIGEDTLFLGFSGTFYGIFENPEKIETREDFDGKYKLTPWPLPDSKMQVVLQTIKKKYPHVKFVYGGSRNYNPVINDVDYIIQGIADSTIIELADHLKNKTPIKFNLTGSRAKVIDYDTKGSRFDFKNSVVEYLDTDHVMNGEPLIMEMSRGCLFRCSFCDYPLIGRKKGDPDYHKFVDNIAFELKNNFEKYGVSTYQIVDDTMNESTKKLEDILRARDKSGVDMRFGAQIRTDLLARYPEQIDLLVELGMETALLGIESLYRPSALAMGKGVDPEVIKDTIYKFKDKSPSVKLQGSFIIGLPHDTPETLNTWIPWTLEKDNPLVSISFNALSLTPAFGGSEITRNPEKYGYTITDIDPKSKQRKWKNAYWNSDEAFVYAESLMAKCWNDGRLKLGGWDAIGIQVYPDIYTMYENTPLNEFDYSLIYERKREQWENYRNAVFTFESK